MGKIIAITSKKKYQRTRKPGREERKEKERRKEGKRERAKEGEKERRKERRREGKKERKEERRKEKEEHRCPVLPAAGMWSSPSTHRRARSCPSPGGTRNWLR